MEYNFESLEIFALICSQIDLFPRERNFYDVDARLVYHIACYL